MINCNVIVIIPTFGILIFRNINYISKIILMIISRVLFENEKSIIMNELLRY